MLVSTGSGLRKHLPTRRSPEERRRHWRGTQSALCASALRLRKGLREPPVAHKNGLLWGIVACCFGLLGLPGWVWGVRGCVSSLRTLSVAALGNDLCFEMSSRGMPGGRYDLLDLKPLLIIEPHTTPSHTPPNPESGQNKAYLRVIRG